MANDMTGLAGPGPGFQSVSEFHFSHFKNKSLCIDRCYLKHMLLLLMLLLMLQPKMRASYIDLVMAPTIIQGRCSGHSSLSFISKVNWRLKCLGFNFIQRNEFKRAHRTSSRACHLVLLPATISVCSVVLVSIPHYWMCSLRDLLFSSYWVIEVEMISSMSSSRSGCSDLLVIGLETLVFKTLVMMTSIETGQHDIAEQPSKLDIWIWFQSGHQEHAPILHWSHLDLGRDFC